MCNACICAIKCTVYVVPRGLSAIAESLVNDITGLAEEKR